MAINTTDRAKIRTATVLYLAKHGEATSKDIQEYLMDNNIPLIGDGATSPQIITNVLKESSNGWRLGFRKDSRNRHVWYRSDDDEK